jgi:hypothetical protein
MTSPHHVYRVSSSPVRYADTGWLSRPSSRRRSNTESDRTILKISPIAACTVAPRWYGQCGPFPATHTIALNPAHSPHLRAQLLPRPGPTHRDRQQCGFVLGFHTVRQSPTVVCIFSELYNVLHRNGLLCCAVPLMEQRARRGWGLPRRLWMRRY